MNSFLISELKTRISVIDKKLILQEKIRNANTTLLLREVFDQTTANDAIALIERLNAIKWPMHSPTDVTDPFILFRTATKSAIAELQQIFSGKDRSKNLFDKIIGLFKKEKDNPLVDVIAFANMLFSFFTLMYKFLSAMGGDDDQTVEEIIGINGKNTLTAIVQKGIKPQSGIIQKLGTNWTKKYLQGFVVNDFVTGISKMTKGDIWIICRQVMQQLSNIADITTKVAAAEDAVEHGKEISNSTEEKLSQQGSKNDVESQETGTTPTQQPQIKPGRQVDQTQRVVLNKVKPALEDLGVKDPARLIAALADMDVLKEPNE